MKNEKYQIRLNQENQKKQNESDITNISQQMSFRDKDILNKQDQSFTFNSSDYTSVTSLAIKYTRFKHIEQNNLARCLKDFIVQQKSIKDAQNALLMENYVCLESILTILGQDLDLQQFKDLFHKLGIDYDKKPIERLFNQYDTAGKKKLSTSDLNRMVFSEKNDFELVLENREKGNFQSQQQLINLFMIHLEVQKGMINSIRSNPFDLKLGFQYIAQGQDSITPLYLREFLTQLHNFRFTKKDIQSLISIYSIDEEKISFGQFQQIMDI